LGESLESDAPDPSDILTILYRHSPVIDLIDLTGSDEEDLDTHPRMMSHIAVEVRLPVSHDGLPRVFPSTNTPQSKIAKHTKTRTQDAHYPRERTTPGSVTRVLDTAQKIGPTQLSHRSPYHSSDSAPNPKRRKVTSQAGYETSGSLSQTGHSTKEGPQLQNLRRVSNNAAEISTYNRNAQERSSVEEEGANHQTTIQEQSRQNLHHVLTSQVFTHIQDNIEPYSSSLTQQESNNIGQRVSVSSLCLSVLIFIFVRLF
jgi:hypothetical protein